MHLKLPLAGLLLAGIGLAVTSCASDPILPSKSELYNREFIKNFGVPDPSHDWNHSQRANITVTTSAPSDIKIYADVNNARYLFGTFLGVNGSRELGVDIPKGVNELIVSCGSISKRVKPGNKVSFSNFTSRSFAGDGLNDPNVQVKSLASDKSRWMVIPWINGTIFRRKMPEDFYNADRPGVSPDFMFRNDHSTPITFVIRPLYWQTSRTHKLGIFYYDASGEKVHVPLWQMPKGKKYTEETIYAIANAKVKYVTVPVSDFQKYMDEFNVVKDKLSAEDNFSQNCTSIDDRDMTSACRKYLQDNLPVLPGRTDGKKFNYVYRWKFLTEAEGGNNDLLIVYTYFDYTINTNEIGGNFPYGKWPAPDGGIPENPIPNEYDTYNAIVSKGIEVTIQPGLVYGYYIEDVNDSSKRYYSTRSENKATGWYPVGDRGPDGHYTKFEQRGKASYAATWEATKYDWRYLAFEDWDTNTSTFTSEMKDLNDLVFIIEDGTPAPTIVDIEHGDKVYPTVPYEWVVAAEDLGTTDDFDFNDLVFGVSNFKLNADGETATVDVRALASGGTLPVYLCYTNQNGKIRLNEGKEFHSWFEGSHTSSTVINASGYRAKGETITITVPKDFAMSCCQKVDNPGVNGNMGGFSVEVEKDGRVVSEIHAPNIDEKDYGKFEAPQMICVPMEWCWPTERTHINLAYSDFRDWTNNASCTEWHKNVTGSVFNRTDIPKPLPNKPTPDNPWGGNGGDNPGGDINPKPVETTITIPATNPHKISWSETGGIYDYILTDEIKAKLAKAVKVSLTIDPKPANQTNVGFSDESSEIGRLDQGINLDSTKGWGDDAKIIEQIRDKGKLVITFYNSVPDNTTLTMVLNYE